MLRIRSAVHLGTAFTLVGMLALLASGCTGGGTSATAVVPPAPRASAATSARLTIAIPRNYAQAAGRRAQFIAPATARMTVDVPPLATQTFTINPGTCTSAGHSFTSCTFTLSAPTGSTTFTIALYDASGMVLAYGSSPAVTMTSSGPNVVTVPLLGVARSIKIYGDTQPFSGTISELLQLVGADDQNEDIYDGIVNSSVVVSSGGQITFTSSSGACPGMNPYTINNPTTLAALLIKECFASLTTDVVTANVSASTLPNAPATVTSLLGVGPFDSPSYHLVIGDTSSGNLFAVNPATGTQTSSLGTLLVPANLAYSPFSVIVGGPNTSYFQASITSGSLSSGSSFAPSTPAPSFKVACCSSGGLLVSSTGAGRAEKINLFSPPPAMLLYPNAGNSAVAVSSADPNVYGADPTHVTECPGGSCGGPTLSMPQAGANYSSVALFPPTGAPPTLLLAAPNANGGVDAYALPITSASVPTAQTAPGIIGSAVALATNNNHVFVADGTANAIFVFDPLLNFQAYRPIDASTAARVTAMVPETRGSANAKIWFTIGPPINAVRALDTSSFGVLYDYRGFGTPQGLALTP